MLNTFRFNLLKSLLPVCLAVVLVLVWGELATACPTCKENMSDDPDSANLVRGYFWSILFMMSMPFLIFTSLCSYFYWEVRKARAQQALLELDSIELS